ncbi:hypothetical protein BAE44_0013393 [Dichanthelium oligosanthes]|uniref:Isopenicillin N synthase-like Fe(2+) 2OG dioxygenase domain-containing protein n=1 Tax=Dichanthelium oligosanthes TaxID=888268 RepID=A0A1E5VKE0_9POAL|nr:hypothetical protein BAE44_0013393 [Dichanthelium oligosanthes]
MKEASLAIMDMEVLGPGRGEELLQGLLRRRQRNDEVQLLLAVPGAGEDAGDGPHCDPAALTLLLQDGAVDGLQVLVDGEW